MIRCQRSCWYCLGLLVAVSLVGCSGSSSDDVESSTNETTTEIRVERLETAEGLFAVVGQEASVWKYSGSDMEFWIELEKDGKKEEIIRGEFLPFQEVAAPGPNQQIEGHFIWLREDAEEDGKENWRVGLQRRLVEKKSQNADFSSPLVEGKDSVGKTDSDVWAANFAKPVQLWKKRKPGEKGTYGGGSWVIPSPLPLDEEFCIETRVESRGEEGEDRYQHHVIRVMCKVNTQKEKTEKSKSPVE